MNEKNTPSWELLAAYLSGETSQEDTQKVIEWLQSNAQNKTMLDDLEKMWNVSPKAFDSKAAFARLDAKIKAETVSHSLRVSHKSTKKTPSISKQVLLGWVAAIFVLGLLGYGLMQIPFQKTTTEQAEVSWIEKSTQAGQRLKYKLSDGTVVWLNGKSTLKYKNTFNTLLREVYLEGEGFFEVSHQNGKPFLIYANQTEVEVLGTSFNVKAYAGEQKVATTVLTGKVQVSSENQSEGEKIILLPGSQAVFDAEATTWTTSKVAVEDYINWKNGILVFKDESLPQVITKLENWYGVTISLQNAALAQCKITASYENYSLEKVLKSIQQIIPIQFTIQEKDVTIQGNSCQ